MTVMQDGGRRAEEGESKERVNTRQFYGPRGGIHVVSLVDDFCFPRLQHVKCSAIFAPPRSANVWNIRQRLLPEAPTRETLVDFWFPMFQRAKHLGIVALRSSKVTKR